MNKPTSVSTRTTTLRTIALLALASACRQDHGRILDPGDGPANEAPLWPLGSGASWGDDARPLVVGQQETPQGSLFTVDLLALGVDPKWVGRRTMDLLETADGDLVGVEPNGDRFLFLPHTVREGMRFRFDLDFPEGSFYAVDPSVGRLDTGDGVWTAEVVERREEVGAWGDDRTVWTLALTGPAVPHHDGPGNKVPYYAEPGAIQALETTEGEVPRWGRTLQFIEGVGPTVFTPGPLGPRLQSAGPRVWTGQPTTTGDDPEPTVDPVAPITPWPPALPGPLAGRGAQAAPDLDAEPLGPIFEPEGAWYLTGTARYARSSVEAAQGAAGELVLMGRSYGTSETYDLNGQRIEDFTGVTAAICLAVDPENGEFLPVDRLAGPCPNRDGQGLGGNAHPYVRPDGRRWDRPDAMRVPSTGGSASSGGTFTWAVVPTEAPFVRDGTLHAVTCGGRAGAARLAAGSLQGCRILSFAHDDPRLLTAETASEQPLEAMVVAGQPPAEPPFLGVRPSPAYSPTPPVSDSAGNVYAEVVIPEMAFAVPFADRVAYVAVDSGTVASGAIWLDYAGNVLRRELLPLWNPSLSIRDGQYTLSDVGPLGDLRVVHVQADGLEVELRGRVAIPEGHRAVHAIEITDGEFLVFTEVPGEGEEPGPPVPAPYESNTSAFGIRPALPPSGLVLHAFRVTAPDGGEVDRDWLLRRPAVQRAGSMVRVCEPPLPAESDATAPPVRAVRIGGRVVDVADAPRDAHGCVLVAGTAEEVATSTETGSTPVALEFEGEGWVTHTLPPLLADVADRAGPWAALPDGSRRYLDALVFPLGAEEWPVSLRVPAIDVDCWKSQSLSIDACVAHLAPATFDTNTLSMGHQDRLIADRGGSGLWAGLDYRWWSWSLNGPGNGPNEGNGGFALCDPGGPCIDPLASTEPPASHAEGEAPFALLDDGALAVHWESPAFARPAPSGGLVGGDHLLLPDGTLTPVAVTGVDTMFRLQRYQPCCSWFEPSASHQWSDGSACGLVPPSASYQCLTPSGLWTPYPDSGWSPIETYVRPAEWSHVDPDLLVTVTPLLTRFEGSDMTVTSDRNLYVRLLDLGDHEERSILVGSLLPPGTAPSTDDASPLNQPGEVHVEGPIAAPDGSVWWSAGPPLSRWIRAGEGEILVGPLPEGATALWSLGDDLVYWEPGLVTDLTATLASGTTEP